MYLIHRKMSAYDDLFKSEYLACQMRLTQLGLGSSLKHDLSPFWSFGDLRRD